jgi:streptogramin lyase
MRRAVAAVALAVLLAAGGAGAARRPLTFVWPTSVAVRGDGSVLVVENGSGRIVSVDPASGRVRTLKAGLTKAYAVAIGPSGAVFVSANGAIEQLTAHGARLLAVPRSDAGPIAVDRASRIVFTTTDAAYRLDTSTRVRLAGGLAAPHGIAVAPGGAVLISDTGHNRVLRVAPGGAVSTLIRVAQPRGLDVAANGTLYVVEAVAHRVGRYDRSGRRFGAVGPRFADPYDVAVTRDGTVYVVDTAALGSVKRVAPSGATTTLSG